MRYQDWLLLVAALVACHEQENPSSDSAPRGQPASRDGRGEASSGQAGAGGAGTPGGQGGVSSAGSAPGHAGDAGSTGEAGTGGTAGGHAAATCEQLPVVVGSCATCQPLTGTHLDVHATCVTEGTIGCVDDLTWQGGEMTSQRVSHDENGALKACLFLPGQLDNSLPGWTSPSAQELETCSQARASRPGCGH
jgi:hypothetical protein